MTKFEILTTDQLPEKFPAPSKRTKRSELYTLQPGEWVKYTAESEEELQRLVNSVAPLSHKIGKKRGLKYSVRLRPPHLYVGVVGVEGEASPIKATLDNV